MALTKPTGNMVNVSASNLVPGSGYGLDFSATSDGSGTTSSELFADYEIGTWTPTITFATAGDLSVAYGNGQAAYYTKIGDRVLVECIIGTSTFTHSSASGEFRVQGLPFTVAAANYGNGAWLGAGWTKASYTSVQLRAIPSTAYGAAVAHGSGAAYTTITAADMPTGGTVWVQWSTHYKG